MWLHHQWSQKLYWKQPVPKGKITFVIIKFLFKQWNNDYFTCCLFGWSEATGPWIGPKLSTSRTPLLFYYVFGSFLETGLFLKKFYTPISGMFIKLTPFLDHFIHNPNSILCLKNSLLEFGNFFSWKIRTSCASNGLFLLLLTFFFLRLFHLLMTWFGSMTFYHWIGSCSAW